ncbi:XK-related protein 6 [Octopus vulgaris]|uniref:XK-related protein n=1 Tax=Octopus vulgaris TaxID=6645 RepID=A0AA36FA04_OCTVU|nr:XK-related protein 6 [Octopus vulgaris]
MSTGRDFHSQDVAIVVLSAIIYLLDVATDVVVVIQFMFEERLIWFSLSLAFVVVPMVCIQVFSLKWLLTKRTIKISCISGFLHFIGLALIKRYADVLLTWSELKTTSDPLRFEKLFQQVHSAFLLRLFQTFLEAAPQLILQSYVLLSTWHGSAGTGFSLIISLISFSWGFVTYSDNLRLQSRNIPRPKWPSFLLQIGWQIGMTLSRVAAIIMFTFCFKSWIFFAIGVHWMLMSLWIIAEKPKLRSVWWQDKLLSCLVGFIYIFCFLHIQNGSGRWRLFFFYALLLLENSLAVIAWLLTPIDIAEAYQWLFTALVFTGFLIGVVCLLLFYCCYHPDQKNSTEDCTSTEDKTIARIERAKPSSSSLTSNRSLMNKHIIDSSIRHTSSVYPCREDPIGCYSKMSDNIHFFSRTDSSPSISGSVSPAVNQGTLFDDSTYLERANEPTTNKIFTSSVIEEEVTPYSSKSIKRKIKHGSLTVDRYKRKEDAENGSLRRQLKCNKSGNFKDGISKAKLMSAPSDMQVHPNYYPQISQMPNATVSPVYHLTKGRRPLARHHSENVKSSSVSTLDNLSDQYHNWQESREESDRYLEMLEKYRDPNNKPAKYTYLNSVYQPTTKPMECKTKEGPLTRLRSSFRRHLNAIKTPTYKEMSPVLNTGQYCTNQETLDSKSGSFQQGHPWPNYEIRHYPRDHAGRFYDMRSPRVHGSNSEEFTYQSYLQRPPCHQVYNEPAHCLNRQQCYNPVTNCNNYCSHKRMSYAENCSHSNLMENAASYQIRKATSLENLNTLNDNQALRNFSTADPYSCKQVPNHAAYRTLPYRPNHYISQYPCSSAFSPCHDGGVYDKANVRPEYNCKQQQPSDAHTYVVYSDKPSANRCVSAPPNPSANYGSLRGRTVLSRQNNPKEPIVDHDFRYCTISSRRSESAPPNENLFRASFKNLRKIPPRSTTYGSNNATETDCYDFRQLTISPVQSMSVPPDKVTSIEALRNLTVSPVRSVSVIPNQSPKEQECYSQYGESSNRPTSVPPDYTFHGKTQNYPQGTEISGMPGIDCNYNKGQRSITAAQSIANDRCLSHGQFTVYSDFNLSIPPDSQTIKSAAEICPSYRTAPALPSVPLNSNQSPLFSCKHPYLPERSLSVPFNSSHSTDTDTDTTSVTSLSSFPDSVSDARSAEDKAAKHLEALDNCLNSETNNLESEMESLKSQSTSDEVDSSHEPTEVDATKSQTTNEEDSPQNLTKLKKMSSHIHSGIAISPISPEIKENMTKNQEIINEQRTAAGTSFGRIPKEVCKTEVTQEKKYNGNEFNSNSFHENHDETDAKIFQEFKKPDSDDSYSHNTIVSKTLNHNQDPISYSQNSLCESDNEEQPRRPQVPKDLPKEKIKPEELHKAFRLSPLTIQQLKNSPLKLGRSQSISIMDKNRLSKLKDKLSPLRIQTLVNSPFKFGRSIDLFDRKKWRSANDILDEVKSETPVCNLVKVKYLEDKNTENVKDFQEGKNSAKEVQNETSLTDRKTTANLSSNYLTDNDEDVEKDNEVNSSNFGTIDDRDWALDVLDHLSRISDHHTSSFSGSSHAFSEKSRQRNITKDLVQDGSSMASLQKRSQVSCDQIPLINQNNCNEDVNELIRKDVDGNNIDNSQNTLRQSEGFESQSSSRCEISGTCNGRLQPNIDWKCNNEQEKMGLEEKGITSRVCQKEDLVFEKLSHLKDPIVLEPLARERKECSRESINMNNKSEKHCTDQRIYGAGDDNSSKLSLTGKYQKKLANVYADAKPSYVGDFISEEDIKNWQVSVQLKGLEFAENNSNANDFDKLNNSLFREKLARETNYLWGSPFDKFKPNFSMDDLSYGIRKFPLRTQSFQSRFPRTVSRPVDPQVMPTIFENKIMTEQFIYDDAISDMYLYKEPQSHQPPCYAYDDQRYTNPKHPLYIYDRSLAYMDSVHPDGYMTIPSKKPANSWNLKKKKKLFSKNPK